MSCSIFGLLKSVSEINNRETLQLYLKSFDEYNEFLSKDAHEVWVNTINDCLSCGVQHDRELGLHLLQVYLSQISNNSFTRNAISWMNICYKYPINDSVNGLNFRVFGKLLQLSHQFQELRRDTKDIIPKFLSELVKCKPAQISLDQLECLKVCMSTYSGPSGDFQSDILRLLLSLVERPTEVILAAACCVPLVAQVGGGGRLGLLYKTKWHQLQCSLLTLLTTLLNKIYRFINCCSETEVTSAEEMTLAVETVTESSLVTEVSRLYLQFTSVAFYLQAMLTEQFPVTKCVNPDAILKLISQSLMPTHSILGVGQEFSAVIAVLPGMLQSMLCLLEALIVCLGRNLVPQSSFVLHLCLQVLVWTNKPIKCLEYTTDKPLKNTRIAAYKCLKTWIATVGAACGAETVIKQSLPILISDINAPKRTIRLKVNSKTKQRGNKKEEERSEKLVDPAANCNLCEAALVTLTRLVECSAPLFKDETLTCIHDTVLAVCNELPEPYSVTKCRSALYQLLLTLCTTTHPRVSPPVSYALAVFNMNRNHPDPSIKIVCATGLRSLEGLLHPTTKTIFFPTKQPEPEEKFVLNTDRELRKRRFEHDNYDSAKCLKFDVGEENIEENISKASLTFDSSYASDGSEPLNEPETQKRLTQEPECPQKPEICEMESNLIRESHVPAAPPSRSSNGTMTIINDELIQNVNDADVSEMLLDFKDVV